MSLDPVETLRQLIQIPSVNPMGRPFSEPTHGEARLTDALQAICERYGWPWLRQRVQQGRENLVAIVAGEPSPADGSELLLWDVHQDTVPVDGMTVAPFGGEVRDGRVYGRGACDVKGSMAAMLAAASRVSEAANEPSPDLSLKGRGIFQRPTVVIAFTVNEECGFSGASALCDLWHPEKRKAAAITAGTISAEGLFPRPPAAAVVAEPTQFQVVVAHHGVVRWRCHTFGRAAHTSRPDVGVNAIYAMAKIVAAVERYHSMLSTTSPEHPLCGRPSACVSTIHGGVGINTVPEHVTIEIDRRLGPEESPETAYRELIQYIGEHADLGKCRIEHDPPFMQSAGLSDRTNGQIAERLASRLRGLDRPSEIVGVPFGTDAAALSAAGIPTVVFGPGSIAQAHTADEFIGIKELQFGTEVFYRIATEGLATP